MGISGITICVFPIFIKKEKKKFPKVAALLESGNTGFFFASL